MGDGMMATPTTMREPMNPIAVPLGKTNMWEHAFAVVSVDERGSILLRFTPACAAMILDDKDALALADAITFAVGYARGATGTGT